MTKRSRISIGDRFNRLTVISDPVTGLSGKWRVAFVDCKCDCGVVVTVRTSTLRNGHTKSCGCFHRDKLTKHGGWRTKLYVVWESMLARCRNKNKKAWSNYGGRGISVCDEWSQFPAFKRWADESGYMDGLSIDRIDNDGNYEPGNCRWATASQQSRNQRSSRPVTAFGETKPLCDWALDPRCVVSLSGMYHRIARGWKPEDAITTRTNRKANSLGFRLT